MERQERKFEMPRDEIKRILSKYQFKKYYPSRIVNSLYFNEENLTSFTNSEEGVSPRNKFRLRWYGKQKFKSFQNLDKIDIISFEQKVTDFFERRKYVSLVDNTDIERTINTLTSRVQLKPKIFISYSRKYFLNKNGIRGTLDRKILFADASKRRISHLSRLNREVFELKFGLGLSPEQIISEVSSFETRFSKYCLAVNALNE